MPDSPKQTLIRKIQNIGFRRDVKGSGIQQHPGEARPRGTLPPKRKKDRIGARFYSNANKLFVFVILPEVELK
jgi:hypothetical protein